MAGPVSQVSVHPPPPGSPGRDRERSAAEGGGAGIKAKKSLDWLPKSFKRTRSAEKDAKVPPLPGQSAASSSSSAAAKSGTTRPISPRQPRYFHSHQSSASTSTAADPHTRSNGSSNSDSHLMVPGSPRHSFSSPSSSNSNEDGGRSGSDNEGCSTAPSQPSPGLPLTPDDAVPLASLRISPPSPFAIPGAIPVGKENGFPTLQHPPFSPPETQLGQSFPREEPAFGKRLLNSEEKQSSEYEKLLLSLSSRKALRTMLDDPVGLWKFGQFLASEMNAETLVFWLNAEQHRNDLKRLYSLTQRIHSLHIPSNAPLALNITSNERSAIERTIKNFIRADDPFKAARDAAFMALYHDAWPRFLQWRLELLQQSLKHGGKAPPATSFTLADPNQDRDQQLLLASDGFLELTGYTRSEILMQNCRFLQGAGTSAATISRIREACKYGTPITELILNYKKDGVPFWSLFRLIPLRNASGKLKYLLGAQENVTSVLSATPDLAHLLGDELDLFPTAPRPPFEHDLAEAQMQDTGDAMRAYLKSLDKAPSLDRRKASVPASSNVERLSPIPASIKENSLAASPVLGPSHSPGSTTSTPRPRSANRDMHLHAAAALAFDGTQGTSSGRSSQGWGQLPIHGRPTTGNSIFARPDTAYSMMDTKGKEEAQLSLAEKTKAFNEASSHYLVLDSGCDLVLFHSANLPPTIKIGSAFPDLVGPQLAQHIKSKVANGERMDVASAAISVPPMYDPHTLWRSGVRLSLTPLKDQIEEVGAVIVLISSNA